MTEAKSGGVVRYLQEFSIPLIVGVVCALLAANLAPDWYQHWFGQHVEGGPHVAALPFHLPWFHHDLTLGVLVNDIFMVLFFGIATKEITEAALPGGSLNPPKKAINPLIATIGGVAGPVAVFFACMYAAGAMGLYDMSDSTRWGQVLNGWGIPTATDIALAWLVARTVFGKGHPAINFLLLLAVADDAIGLVIIAVFYGDPANPARPEFLGLVAAGMAVAFAMRKMGVKNWLAYVFIAGPLAWYGLVLAHLHPALALVPIVPFMPGPRRDVGLFTAQDEIDVMGDATAADLHMHHSTLDNFEHKSKPFVDFGLFFFAMSNAGVQFAGIGTLTWVILIALVVGKTIGVFGMGWIAVKAGFSLPAGMNLRDLTMAGLIAALGLTVALFVAGAAYPAAVADLQGQAKMGALFSGFVGIVAIVLGKMLGFGKSGSGSSAGAAGGAKSAAPESGQA